MLPRTRHQTVRTRVVLLLAQIMFRRSQAKPLRPGSSFHILPALVAQPQQVSTFIALLMEFLRIIPRQISSTVTKKNFDVRPRPGSDFDQCVTHFLERKLEGSIVALEEAEAAVSCGFASPTCAVHNLYPLSEGLRRLLTDGETATMECMMLPEEARRRNLRSPDSKKEAPSGESPKAGSVGGHPAHSFGSDHGGRCELWKPFSLDLTRAEYERSCASLFDRGVAPVDRLLDYLDIRVDEIDEVVMVGGMTRTPRVRSLLMSHLGVDRLNVDIDPDVVVAYGAATIAH